MMPKIFAMRRYIEQQLETVRRQGGEGLIAELVRVEKEGGQISRDEIVSMVFLLLFAGHETTTHLISGSVYRAAEEPGAARLAGGGLEPRSIWRSRNSCASSRRCNSPSRAIVRRDVDLGGVRLRKGEKIMAMLAAANMDPQANPHPERLDLQRKPNRHIAFGTGIHFCLGHQLARIEGRCALKALFRRWPELTLAVDRSEIKWRKRPGLSAIDRLPVVAIRQTSGPGGAKQG